MTTRSDVAGAETRAESPAPRRAPEGNLGDIARALGGLRFGEVRIVVQDGVVVQIDRTERLRPLRVV